MHTLKLADPLFDRLDALCRKEAAECPLGECVTHPDRHPERLGLAVHGDFGECLPTRRMLRDTRCQQCTMLLLLQAIQRNLPHSRIKAWLDEPLFDLQGRTPRECLEAGDYDPVIDAVWLLDESELTDG